MFVLKHVWLTGGAYCFLQHIMLLVLCQWSSFIQHEILNKNMHSEWMQSLSGLLFLHKWVHGSTNGLDLQTLTVTPYYITHQYCLCSAGCTESTNSERLWCSLQRCEQFNKLICSKTFLGQPWWWLVTCVIHFFLSESSGSTLSVALTKTHT